MTLAKRILFGIMSLLLVFGLMPSVIVSSSTLADTPTSEVWVDDDFNESTPGWGIDHLTTIQNSIDSGSVSTSDLLDTDFVGNPRVVDGDYNGVPIVDVGAFETPAHAQWPMFHYDERNTGVSPYVGPDTPYLKWAYETGGDITLNSAAIGADGTVYIGSGYGTLYALKPDGSLKWNFSAGASVHSPAIGTDGMIYFGSSGGNVYALHPDGSLNWTFSTPTFIYASITIGPDGTIYVGAMNDNLYAINPDGTEKWRIRIGGIHEAAAIDSHGTIYVGGGDSLYSVSAEGSLNWSYPVRGVLYTAPAIGDDGTIYATSGILYALNPDGTLAWSYETGSSTYSPTVGPDGTVYVAPGSRLCAIEPGGQLMWSYSTSERVYTPIIDRHGTVYAGIGKYASPNNRVMAFNADGTVKWSYPLGGIPHCNSPAIDAQGTLYLGTSDGKLYAIGEASPEADFVCSLKGGVVPAEVSFKDLSTGDITSWQWDFDNDGVVDSTEQNPSYTYQDTGIYTVSLTVTGSAGSDTETKVDHIELITLEDAIGQIQTDVSYLRYLLPLSDVDVQFITEEELEEMLEEEITEEELEEISITQELLVMLDQMDEGEDLYSILMDLYSGSIAGFYDDEQETMYIVSDGGELESSEKMTIAHEYTHALQDQHFDLSSLFDFEYHSDAYMAIDSLVEGDARLVESLYFWNCLTEEEREAYWQSVEGQGNGGIEDIPRIILEGILFPYIEGKDFVYALATEGGWNAVNLAYSDPPQSTEQILHPEKYYLERDNPQAVTMPDLEGTLGVGWSQLESDVLGELDTRIYLETFLGIGSEQASNAAEGWDGDRYAFLKDADGRRLLVMSSVWDSVVDAEEFFDAYVAYVNTQTGGACTLVLDSTNEKWWDTAESSIYLGMHEDEVVIIIAPDVPVAGQVLTEFPEFHSWPQVDFCVSHTEAVTGEPVQFNDCSIGTATSWAWDFDGDGEVDSTDQHPSYTYDEAGVYTISFTAFDPIADYTETKENLITVYIAPDAEFSASTNAAVMGQIIQFTDRSTGDIASWAWDFDVDGVVDSTEQNPSYAFTDPGTYTVSLTVSNPATDDTETKEEYILVSEALCCQVVTPESDHVVQTPDGTIIIHFPAGSVSAQKQVIIRRLTPEEVASAPAGFGFGNTYFAVEGAGELGEIVTITVKYTDEDVAVCSDPSLLTLARYDEESGEWVAFPTTVDTAEQTLTTTTDQLSNWIVMAEAAEEMEQTEQTKEVPVGSVDEPSDGWPLWVWGLLVVAGVLVVGTLIFVLRRRGGQETA